MVNLIQSQSTVSHPTQMIVDGGYNCNFHVDESRVNHKYNMILGRDILSEIKIYLCLSRNTIKGNIGAHKGCMSPMKDAFKNNFNTLSDWINNKIFWNKELWESEHVLDATQRMHFILYYHYEKRTYVSSHQKVNI